MDALQNAAVMTSGRQSGKNSGPTERRGTRRHTDSHGRNKLPISCRDSSLQARVVMDQISRERGQLYKESIVQTVLGQQSGNGKSTDSRPPRHKLRFPNIDEKTIATNHSIDSDTHTQPCVKSKALRSYYAKNNNSKLPPTTFKFQKSFKNNRNPPNSLPSCSSASSSGGKVSAGKPIEGKRRAVYKSSITVLTTPASEGSKSEARLVRSNDATKYSQITGMPRSHTHDTIIPRRSLSSERGMPRLHPPSTETQTTRRYNLRTTNSHSDSNLSSKEAHISYQNLYNLNKDEPATQINHMPHEGLQHSLDNQEGKHSQSNLTRDKSFEITFPGYDTRFLDLPEPTWVDDPVNIRDIDRQIESTIQASSVEKCRRWLNKWVLPP